MTRSLLAQSLRDILTTNTTIQHSLDRGDCARAADQLTKSLTAAGFADVPRAQVLEEAAAAIEAERAHIPPSTHPTRASRPRFSCGLPAD